MRLSRRSGAFLGVLGAAEVALLGLGDTATASPIQWVYSPSQCEQISFVHACGFSYTGTNTYNGGNVVDTSTSLGSDNVDIAAGCGEVENYAWKNNSLAGQNLIINDIDIPRNQFMSQGQDFYNQPAGQQWSSSGLVGIWNGSSFTTWQAPQTLPFLTT
jgi:hypothetical protein